ncbi:GNAT family N-acetyltransferase [Saccharibacillus alkalitolerans]|uniref:GNAT family N-acetyltransferase n=1 Tax=Saccharibacillus alkalitolerans TaxID=2705290 RepID=A0ABX0F457_9BACL|nr:GNAT family protein [Saccharibacillus alkalitolerans]NGZ74784.1 GNAT family N-acetyltransferase [Saccharibacillus alkalitolerans]
MMERADFAEKPLLLGQKTILRPFGPGDAERMMRILAESEVRRLTGSAANDEEASAPMSADEEERIKSWYAGRNDQSDRLDLAVADRESGELVGEVVFNEYDENAGSVNFRILIGSAGRGKGLGTEAVPLFLKYGFEKLGLHRITLEVFSFNPRAERVYVKSGFVLEGVKREDFRYNGEYVDTKIYGMLRSDYERIAGSE